MSTSTGTGTNSGGGSTKKEDERKRQFVTTVLALPPTMATHPVVGSMVSKYIKMSGHEDKAAFQLDVLRMVAIARAANVAQ
uniref:Small capsomere-interacting protein n=1 Tax=Mastomys natalensis cytomegalovirus 1 TaxID=2973541 RepID=A0A9Y1N7F8_9BETA|nr:small capsid protein [Mastomys natalensis cytomegalovirus 1]WEG68916.1 small capsid protein [Mastomys natalensis cytomegalovirus 1]WEG71144.1 small capsid protein [Mastomys natalensis cytomegalovirus 1]